MKWKWAERVFLILRFPFVSMVIVRPDIFEFVGVSFLVNGERRWVEVEVEDSARCKYCGSWSANSTTSTNSCYVNRQIQKQDNLKCLKCLKWRFLCINMMNFEWTLKFVGINLKCGEWWMDTEDRIRRKSNLPSGMVEESWQRQRNENFFLV